MNKHSLIEKERDEQKLRKIIYSKSNSFLQLFFYWCKACQSSSIFHYTSLPQTLYFSVIKFVKWNYHLFYEGKTLDIANMMSLYHFALFQWDFKDCFGEYPMKTWLDILQQLTEFYIFCSDNDKCRVHRLMIPIM